MRPRRLHTAIVAVLAALFALPSHAEYIIPSPPMGWEERVTPGFDPSIESVLVRMSRIELQNDKEVVAIWAKWNEGAVDVLLKLRDDKAWKEFQHQILRLLALCPYDRGVQWVENTFKALATKSAMSKDEQQTLSFLMYSYPKRDPAQVDKLIDLCLREGNLQSRHWAIGCLIAMRTDESLARAKEAIENLADVPEKAWLLKSVEEARGYIRAKEPMDVREEKGERK